MVMISYSYISSVWGRSDPVVHVNPPIGVGEASVTYEQAMLWSDWYFRKSFWTALWKMDLAEGGAKGEVRGDLLEGIAILKATENVGLSKVMITAPEKNWYI